MVPNPEDPPSLQRPPKNPMFDLIPHRRGETNRVPSFIIQYGPIREARFIRKPDGSPDGGGGGIASSARLITAVYSYDFLLPRPRFGGRHCW
jgi:hypothetical protein